jgi:hypothetical protein
VYEGLRDGTCAIAITTVSTWEGYQYDALLNGDCNLEWIGQVFRPVQSGFTLKADSGVFCTSLLADVMNLELVEMVADGFMGAAWAEYQTQTATIFCDEIGNTAKRSNQMTMQNMGGIFLFHGMLMTVSLLMAVVVWYRSERMIDSSKNEVVNAGKTEREPSQNGPLSPDRPEDVPLQHLNMISRGGGGHAFTVETLRLKMNKILDTVSCDKKDEYVEVES